MKGYRGFGFKPKGMGFLGLSKRVLGFGFKRKGMAFGVQANGYGVLGLSQRVWGLGKRNRKVVGRSLSGAPSMGAQNRPWRSLVRSPRVFCNLSITKDCQPLSLNTVAELY